MFKQFQSTANPQNKFERKINQVQELIQVSTWYAITTINQCRRKIYEI